MGRGAPVPVRRLLPRGRMPRPPLRRQHAGRRSAGLRRPPPGAPDERGHRAPRRLARRRRTRGALRRALPRRDRGGRRRVHRTGDPRRARAGVESPLRGRHARPAPRLSQARGRRGPRLDERRVPPRGHDRRRAHRARRGRRTLPLVRGHGVLHRPSYRCLRCRGRGRGAQLDRRRRRRVTAPSAGALREATGHVSTAPSAVGATAGGPRIATLRAELRDDTAFVAVAEPRLTWAVENTSPGWIQTRAEATDGRETVALDGRDSVLVAWPFTPLSPGESREVSVRAFAVDGETEWSEPVTLTAGFLADGEWVARPVGLADPERDAQPALVRTSFRIDRPVSRALLFWTALGVA